MIQWLQINIVIIFAKNRGKKNVYFSAAVEEVKHWKMLKHRSTQTFISRPFFNLCGAQTQLKISCSPGASLPWSAMHTQNVWEWTRVTFTNFYHYNCEKRIQIMFGVLNTRHRFFESIQSIFALQNDFRSIQVTVEEWFAIYLLMQLDCRNINRCINTLMYLYTPSSDMLRPPSKQFSSFVAWCSLRCL